MVFIEKLILKRLDHILHKGRTVACKETVALIGIGFRGSEYGIDLCRFGREPPADRIFMIVIIVKLSRYDRIAADHHHAGGHSSKTACRIKAVLDHVAFVPVCDLAEAAVFDPQ